MPVENIAIILGLASALSWGAGDFVGGYAARRANAYTVVLATQILGIIVFPVMAVVFSEDMPSLDNLIWGGFSGFFGAAGLIALYVGLARGKMSIVAPIAAVISLIIPVIYSAFYEGMPSLFKVMGFVFAFIGIWLIASMGAGSNLKLKDLEYPFLAGILFGLFFISIDRFSSSAIYWPLTVSRITALLMLAGFMMCTKNGCRPSSGALAVVVLAAFFNTGGSALFALASGAGRLDVASILASLSPAVTVLLACVLLKEHIALRQWSGVIAVLFAIVLISM